MPGDDDMTPEARVTELVLEFSKLLAPAVCDQAAAVLEKLHDVSKGQTDYHNAKLKKRFLWQLQLELED